MDNLWVLVLSGVASVYFGVQTLRLLPPLARLVAALRSRTVKWPGPIAEYPLSETRKPRMRIVIHEEHLFSTFTGFTLGVIGAFVYSMCWFINGFLLVVLPEEGKSWLFMLASAIVFLGGQLSVNRASHNVSQLITLLSDLSSGVEPRHATGRSAEAEYAIEHPLVGPGTPSSGSDRALNLYRQSLRYLHSGDKRMSDSLYHKAVDLDPSLHERALESLSAMLQGSITLDEGPIYYWLGVHSEYLGHSQQAADWYEKAANSFGRIGHEKRQGRAYSNLGTIQAKLGNYAAAMPAFERAVVLNTTDGIAHLNIAMVHYFSGNGPESPEHERALESFANAIVADPERYGPEVASRMRSYSYTWQEDLRDVQQRVLSKQRPN